MAKMVILDGTLVISVVAPGTQAFVDAITAQGYMIKTEEDSLYLEPGWTYDPETTQYSAP